jgi:hypothetical protein
MNGDEDLGEDITMKGNKEHTMRSQREYQVQYMNYYKRNQESNYNPEIKLSTTATHAKPSIDGVSEAGCWPCNDPTGERSSRLGRTMKPPGAGVLHLGGAVNGRQAASISKEEG